MSACSTHTSRSEHPWMHCTAGVTGGALATMLFYPLDFLRTRMHTIHAGSRTNPLCSAREIIQSEGLRGMYRGIGVSVASHSVGWGLYLLTFHSAHRQINALLESKGYTNCNPSYKDFASACVAATVTGTILTPLQVLKTRRQLSDGKQQKKASGCRSIISKEGWRSLFKGVGPQIVLTGNTTIQVTLYEFLRRRFFTNTDNPSPWQVAMASAVSKAISSALFNPIEVVRTRLQAHRSHQGIKEYQGMMDGLATIWRTEGLAGMYRGLPVNVARVIPSTVFAFIAYEKCLSMINNAHQLFTHWSTMAASNALAVGRAQISWQLNPVHAETIFQEMKNALDSFAVVRLPYHGIKDTAKCIEVDLSMNRLYVACNAGGVFVWDLVTHQPFALLKHEQWVNAVRCYPPRNTFDAGEEEQYSQSPPIVLTACENGVLSAWCPTTFLIKARVRPGTGPLTDMHIARVEKHTKKFITRGEFLCYVVSLRHVYVIQVLPEFQVLHDLVHEGVVLCLQAHHSLRTQSLLCGQENGCISLWSLSSGRYECTLEYPPDAKDIADDSKIASIHRPSLGEKGAVAHTFTYNKCRSKAQHEKESVRFEDTPLEVVKYIHTMPGELDPFFFKNPVENELLRVSPMGVWQSWFSSSVTMNASASNVGASDSNTFTYDLRRVTCLAAGARDSRKSNRFYSGHGTGEVLIWEVTFPRQPVMLLKKVQVFAFSSWVWRMQAMEVPRTEDPNEPFSADPTKPVFLQLCVWGDSGAVRYMQATGKVVVTDGPGFLATSSFFWRGPQMDLRCGQDTNLQKKLSKSVEKLPSSTVPGEEHPGENASGNASLSSQTSTKTGYYMIMGSFEGRLEIFDVLPIVEKLRHRSW